MHTLNKGIFKAMRVKQFFKAVFAIILLASTYNVSGQDVIRASGGTNISIDSLFTGGYVTLSGPTIRETASGQLVQNGTIVLTLPTGYEWNTALTSTDITLSIEPTGAANTKLEATFTSITSTSVTIVINTASQTNGNGQGPGRIEINGLQLRPTNTNVPDNATITNTGTTGPNLNYGDLSKKTGDAASVSVETAANGSGEVVQAQNLTAGNPLTVYAIARDTGGNFIENTALSSPTDWQLFDVNGNISAGSLVPASNLRSAVFNSQKTGNAKIKALKSGLTSVPSNTITVLPRNVDRMEFETQPSANAIAGEVFSQQPVIHLYDIFDNLVTTDNSTQATLSIQSGNGTLSGTTTQTAASGVISFSGLSSEIANTITLKASSSGLTDIITNEMAIDHNEAVDLQFLQQPSNTSQNNVISPPVTVQLLDDFGNIVDSSGVTINISNESYFSPSNTFSATTDASGIASFSNLSIKNSASIGTASFNASFIGINAPVSSAFFEIISTGDLAKFVVQNTSDSDILQQTAGQSFPIRIKALNGNDEVFTSFTDTVRVTSQSQILINGNPVTGFSTDAFTDGILDTTITLASAGDVAIFVENQDVNRSGQSNSFTVLPAAYSTDESIISASPEQITADGVSTSTVTVSLKDEFGNNLINGGETVKITTTAGTFPGSLTTITATDIGDGTYTASLTSITSAGTTASLSATINDVTISDTASVDFVSGTVASYIITVPQDGSGPASQIAGEAFNITIEAKDAFGNRVLSFNEDIAIASNSVLTTDAAATLTNGIISNHPVILTRTGTNITLSVSSEAVFGISGTSETFTVLPNEPDASTSEVNATPSVLLNESSYQSSIQIILRDAYNNRVFAQHDVNIQLDRLELNNAPSSGTPSASASSFTFNAIQGLYTATLTATNTIELIEITGFFGSAPAVEISDKATIDVVLPKLWSPGGGPGTTKTDWTNGGNWEPEGAPNVDDFVVIQGGSDPPVLDLNITIGSMEVGSGVSVVLFGGNAIEVSGNLEINGTLDIEDNTDIIVNGSFVGSGAFSAGMETTITVKGDISLGSFLARTNGTIINLNGTVQQEISVNNFLAEHLQINNDVLVTSGTNLVDVFDVNVAEGFTLELEEGGGITVDVENEIVGEGNFVLNDNTFVLRGNSEIEGFDASEGTVIFGIRLDEDFNDYPDLSQQIISTFSNIKNAIINNTAGVKALGDIPVNGTITLQNGPFILESGNSLIANNIDYVNGFLRTNRLINASPGWRMIASPVRTTYADLLDKTVTQGFTNSSLGNAPLDSLQPNVMWYDETFEGTDNQRWRAPADANDSLTSGRGLFVYFFGNVPGDSRYNTSLPLTIDADGRENPVTASEFTFPVTYTANADTGWNLIGNPFAAALDWDRPGWTKTNIDNVLYVWDPETNDYLYWNGIGGGDIEGEKMNSGKIRPFQAFWVKANAANPILKVNTSSKTSGGTFAGKQQKYPAGIGLLLQTDNLSKPLHFTFSPDGKTGKDARDAFRLLPFETNTYLEFFSTLQDGTQLAINNFARNFGTEMAIPIHVGGYKDGAALIGEFKLSWPQMDQVPDSWNIILEDLQTGNKINLKEHDEYYFNHSSPQKMNVVNQLSNYRLTEATDSGAKEKANSKARFLLYITPGEDAEGLPDKFDLSNNYPNPFNNSTKFVVSIPVEGHINLTIYDILGRKVSTLANSNLQAGYHEISWNAMSAASGVYFAVLNTPYTRFVKKVTLLK